MKVILASGSPYRQAQLTQMGLPFTVVVPGIDEEKIKAALPEPKQLAGQLAQLKGEAVVLSHPQDLIIAADQVAFIHNEILSKPKTRERAIAQLEVMQGQVHHLATAIWAYHPNHGAKHDLVMATLKMRKLDRATIERYVDVDQPLDCAGSYKIEKAGISLIESMECSDPSSITGLPLMSLSAILKLWELPFPFEWKSTPP